MRVLVTGGSGLVGRYVVRDLCRDHDAGILDIRPPADNSLPFHKVDLMDAEALKAALKGYDAVVHLAGIPHPLNDPADVVFRTNALGTYNILEACAANDIQRFVFISSESVLGFAFSTTRMWPLFAPIDESHPLRPQDPYGLSKVAAEQICAGFTRRTGMQTICLRPPWIWAPEPSEIGFYRRLRSEYRNWPKNLWAYIHVLDVAGAVRECLASTTLPSHDSYFICAPGNWTDCDSRSLLGEFYPETISVSPQLAGNASLLSAEKARKAFGFSPRYSWRDILQ